MFSAFSSIEQFRSVVKRVKDYWNITGVDSEGKKIYTHGPLPKIKFLGTVKLHGQNSGIIIKNDEYFLQSRNQPLNKENSTDQNGFVGFANDILNNPYFKLKIEELKSELAPLMTEHSSIGIYGEWCGKGIQKGVALSSLEKMFVIFRIKVLNGKASEENIDDSTSQWVPLEMLKVNLSIPNLKIFTSHDFEKFEVEIDFEKPEYAQNEFVRLTQMVESECPVGKYFNVKGIGEGIVWSPHFTESLFISKVGYSKTTFKTKGEKHSPTKVKTIASIDIEKVENLNEFIEKTCTESRLNQGWEYLKEMKKPLSLEATPDFLRWMFNDIVKEEKDTMEKNNINSKDLGSQLSKKARPWFLAKVKDHESF